MRIAVSTIGKFHAFNLAEELARRGALAAAFTSLPSFRVRMPELDPRLVRTFPWITYARQAIARTPWVRDHLPTGGLDRLAHRAHDRWVARDLPDCDAVYAMSGSSLCIGREAQQRGAVYCCARGSSHIEEQDRLLREEYALLGLPFAGVPNWAIEAELAEYAEADTIQLPSTFVYDSFIARGVSEEKLFLNPYGVELRDFRPCAPKEATFTVLFAGSICIRKGVHTLLQAFNKAGISGSRLWLAGGGGGEAAWIFKRSPMDGVERLGKLSWGELAVAMSRASVFVLPSIEEGLATVQAQALACGTPIIATTNTGAASLITDGVEGFILPIRDPDAIAEKLVLLHERPDLRQAMSEAALRRVKELGGWRTFVDGLVAKFESMRTTSTRR